LAKLLLIAVAISSALILAAALSRLELRAGQPFPLAGILDALRAGGFQFSGGISVPPGLIQVIAGCLWLLFFISIVAFVISPEVRKGVFRRLVIYLFWLLLFFSVIRALQSNLLQFPQLDPQGPAELLPADLTDPAEVMPVPPDFIVDPPQWIVIAVTVTLVAILLGLMWGLWRFFAGPRTKQTTTLEQLTGEAQQALAGLQAGADLKDTVMRCYFDMNQILSKQHNVHRETGMTAREFEIYLAESGFSDDHVEQLTRLFETVRYGRKRPGQKEEKEAAACLTAIVQAYGRSPTL
jgi:hypothetical protein